MSTSQNLTSSAFRAVGASILVAAAVLAVSALVPSTGTAQSAPWVVEVESQAGSLGVDAARRVLEAARGRIASCTDGPGPHRFTYTLSLRVNGQVREAAYDRGATSDPRAARCIRHALLGLHFPAHAEAATLALTVGAGAFEPSAPGPSTSPETSPAPGPIAPAPQVAPPQVAPPQVAPGPGPIATPMPRPSGPEASGDVTVGAVGATPERTAAQLLGVITPQRPSLVACYAAARSADGAVAGDAMLHLTISPDGRVTNAMFQGPEALAAALASCVGQAARAWTFGAASAEARVSIPLTFGAARPAERPIRR